MRSEHFCGKCSVNLACCLFGGSGSEEMRDQPCASPVLPVRQIHRIMGTNALMHNPREATEDRDPAPFAAVHLQCSYCMPDVLPSIGQGQCKQGFS